MTAQIGSFSLSGIVDEASQYPFLVASGITASDIGKAVALDTAANTVKLAGDADTILGVLQTFEDRVAEGIRIGTVALRGTFTLAVNPNATASTPDETPDVGDYLEGATSSASVKGFVQKAQSGQIAKSRFLVVEVISATSVVAITV